MGHKEPKEMRNEPGESVEKTEKLNTRDKMEEVDNPDKTENVEETINKSSGDVKMSAEAMQVFIADVCNSYLLHLGVGGTLLAKLCTRLVEGLLARSREKVAFVFLQMVSH